MPTKKPSKKKLSDSSASKKKHVSQKNTVKKNIEEAVERIPNLIVEAAKKEQVIEQEMRPRLKQQYHHEHKQKRQILWVGVSLLGVAICAMWILNTQATIKTIVKDPSDNILSIAKTDFQDVLDQFSFEESKTSEPKPQEKVVDKKNIEETLFIALTALANKSATSTSTEKTTTVQDLSQNPDDMIEPTLETQE